MRREHIGQDVIGGQHDGAYLRTEHKRSGAANGSAACIIKEESLSIASGTLRSKPECVDYHSSKSIHSTGSIRP